MSLRLWTPRLLGLAALLAGAWVVLSLQGAEPQPVPLVLVTVLVGVLLWLVLDHLNAPATDWHVPVEALAGESALEENRHSRILTSHLDADHPGPALHDQLRRLAQLSDPELADPGLRLLHEPVRLLSTTEIDRLLTRIEELRGHH